DHRPAVPPLEGAGGGVQPEAGLVLLRAVAAAAVLRQDRLDVAQVIDRPAGGRPADEQEKQERRRKESFHVRGQRSSVAAGSPGLARPAEGSRAGVGRRVPGRFARRGEGLIPSTITKRARPARKIRGGRRSRRGQRTPARVVSNCCSSSGSTGLT